MRKPAATVMWLPFVLALSACATPLPTSCQPVEVTPAQLPPPPADVMVRRAPNFLDRLLNFFTASPAKQTTSPDSSPPASR